MKKIFQLINETVLVFGLLMLVFFYSFACHRRFRKRSFKPFCLRLGFYFFGGNFSAFNAFALRYNFKRRRQFQFHD